MEMSKVKKRRALKNIMANPSKKRKRISRKSPPIAANVEGVESGAGIGMELENVR